MRELYHMHHGRQEAEWLRVGVAVAMIVNRNGWTKKDEAISPLAVIPEPYRPEIPPEPPKTEEQIEDESRRAWFVLDSVFGRAG